LMTFKHHVHILDATDGYIEEPLMIELEKLKELEVEVEITIDYSAGRPARMPSFRNETGDPKEHEEWETEQTAHDYAWTIVKDICTSLNGLPLQTVLHYGQEIMGSMLEGIEANIKNWIDQDLPDCITSYLEDR